jgi:hypothetical protein|tara:strand:+ start:417 stop:767 length:351 start_codon:yes stop_codon:yes gene_type:complete
MSYFTPNLKLKTAEEIKNELDTLSEVLAEKVYQYRLLEENKKILLSQLTVEEQAKNNCSVAQAEKIAMSSEKYKLHIQAYCVAEQQYSKAKFDYANMNSYIDYLRTYISAQKSLMN